jgi:hypothetical protein
MLNRYAALVETRDRTPEQDAELQRLANDLLFTDRARSRHGSALARLRELQAMDVNATHSALEAARNAWDNLPRAATPEHRERVQAAFDSSNARHADAMNRDLYLRTWREHNPDLASLAASAGSR